MTSGGYAAPKSLDEAVSLLAGNPDARVLAGGHGLLVEPSRSQLEGTLLVDLRKVPGLSGIARGTDGAVTLGAMTTLGAVAADETINKTYPALAEAAQSTGDAQSRNRATLGGSLASTDPDADLPALALMLEATLDVVGPKGARTVAADALVAAAPALTAGEVITALRLPAPAAGSGMAYAVHRNPATLAPICGVAASLTLGRDGTVSACRVVQVSATPRPTRLAAVEQAMVGQQSTAASVASAAGKTEGLAARADLFASAEYRAHLTRVLTARALERALARARG